jgi:hypothetical protein
MNHADDVILGRTELERAFTALGERQARPHVVADIFIVGGAAMALAYDADRVARNVDAMLAPHEYSPRKPCRSPTTSGCPTGGSTSRPASTSPQKTTVPYVHQTHEVCLALSRPEP